MPKRVLTRLALSYSAAAMLALSLLLNAQEARPAQTPPLSYIHAVKLGKTAQVKRWLSQGIAVDDKQGGRYTALFYASAKNYTAIVELLLSYDADVNAAGQQQWTPLMAAALHGHHDIIKLLIKSGANLEDRNAMNMTALLIAVSQKHEQSASELIDAGAQVNAVNQLGRSVLDIAVERNLLRTAKQLLSTGATINKTSIRTLAYAVKNNAVDMLALLLENGADINTTDKLGNTVLHRLVGRVSAQTLSYLLKHKLAWRKPNSHGETVLDIAAASGNVDNTLMLWGMASDREKHGTFLTAVSSGVTDTVAALIKHGADVNAQNNHQTTALMMATMAGHKHIVKLLLDNNADIATVDKQGRNVLMVAVSRSPLNVPLIKLLLQQGVDVSKQDNNGNAALLLAVKHIQKAGDIVVIEQLLKAGADKHQKNKKKQTPVSVATALLDNPASTLERRGVIGKIIKKLSSPAN